MPLLNYFEFFYRSEGSDVGFGEGRSVSPDERARVRTKNGINLLSLDACDWGLTATRWQWQQYPVEYRGRISIIHEGVDTVRVAPRPDAHVELPDGRTLTRDDEVVTYVARNLEPYRGFPTFMRAVETICHRRPRTHIVIVGGDEISYGSPLPNGEIYRERLLSEVSVDLHRVHFLGRIPYPQFLRLLQVSSVHVYLTYPFVLSWSMLEAMASGCLVIGSATPPVQEVLEDGRNGLLVDFFSPDEIADRVDEVLGHRDHMAELRRRARETILEGYDLAHCLPRQLALIEDLAAGRTPSAHATSPKLATAPRAEPL